LSLTSVAFSPDGKEVLTGSQDNTAILWEAQTGRRVRTLEGHSYWVLSVAFSPDGRQVLTGSQDRTARLWEARTGRLLRTFQGHAGGINSVAFSPDGKEVLTGSDDKTAILWEVRTGGQLRSFQGHTDEVVSVASSGDGRQVLTGSRDKTAMLWEVRTGRLLRTIRGHTEPVTSVAFSPDGLLVLTGSMDDAAVLWEARTGRALHSFRSFQGHPGRVTSVAFSPDGRHVLTGSSSLRQIRGDSFDLWDGAAILWEARTGRRVRSFQGHIDGVKSVAFSGDGRLVLTGSADGTAILWQARTGSMLRIFRGHTGGINSVAFSPDGRHALTGAWDGSARLWDVATGDELVRLISLDGGQDWAVLTPEGLFDGSRGGRQKVSFRVGGKLGVVPLDRFFQDFYYPGLLAGLWAGERPRPGKPFQTNPAPLVRMLANPDGDRQDRVTVDVALTDQGGGIKGPWLFHNGAAVSAGHSLLRQAGQTAHHRFSIPLVPGDNRFEVRAASADGSWESEPAVASLRSDGTAAEPELYVLAVGINRFARDAGIAGLDFCAPDARAVAGLFRRRAGKLYRRVHVTLLLDEQASKEGILQALAAMARQAKAPDTLVLYVASHGFTVGQRFYLFPYDFRLDRGEQTAAPPPPRPAATAVGLRGYGDATDQREQAVQARGLAIDELGEALAEVPALKRVLIFDTCHSGSAIQLAGKPHNPFAFRGAMERFNRAQGVYSLAATSSDELAAESKELGHSILTYALLAGAGAAEEGPLAGRPLPPGPGGPAVDVLHWFGYARDQVPALYQRYVGRPQHVELSGEDQPSFPLLSRES
jgi:WD40 repeat protein